MSHEAFVQAVALGLFVPGPNMLHVFHIGNQIAGLPGALAAGLGMFGPTSLLLAGVAKLESRSHPPRWVQRFHRACGPITIGLMAAAAWNLGQNLTGNIFYILICCVATLLTAKRFLGPAWVVLFAALFGAVHTYWLGA
jgi:chromate transporter